MRRALWAVVATALTGCGGAAKDARFPTKDELAALAKSPVRAAKAGDRKVATGPWTLAGPLPEQVGDTPATSASPFLELVKADADKHAGLFMISEGMSCAARELGLHFAKHEAYASRELREFIAGACGVSNALAVATSVYHGKVEGETEAQVFERWRPELVKMVADGTGGGGTRVVGGWFGVSEGRAVAMLVSAPREASIQPAARVPGAEGWVKIEGEALSKPKSIALMVNQGPFGYAHCEMDPTVAAPKFVARCPVKADDATAWISVGAFQPGRVLGDLVAAFQVWPAGQPVTAFTPAPAEGATPPDPQSMRQELFDALNAVRKAASLSELRLADEQCKLAGELVGHYYAGDDDEEVADQVALGMIAGWDVPGLVREGHFASGWVDDTPLSSALLQRLVAMPFGRKAVLDPDAAYVAIGGLRDESAALGAIVSTYAVIDPATTKEQAKRDADAFYAELAKQRKLRGLAPARRLVSLESFAHQDLGGQKFEETDDAEDTFQELAKRVNVYTKKAVRGWYLSVNDMKDLDLPNELLLTDPLDVAVVVGYTYAPPSPWASRLIMVVFPDNGGQVAGAPAGPVIARR